MCYTPYEPCLGRKYRFAKSLNRPLVVIFNTHLCHINIKNKEKAEKAKISLLLLVINLFYKDCLGFRIDGFFQNNINCQFVEGDYINLICHATKAVVKKLLGRLHYELDDYKLIKRRKYTLKFTFYFVNCEEVNVKKNVTVDISCNENDMLHFFFTLTSYYTKEFIQMLFFYYLEECKEIEEDYSDSEEEEEEEEEEDYEYITEEDSYDPYKNLKDFQDESAE